MLGNVSDRSNPRCFSEIGLIVSVIMNLFLSDRENIVIVFLLMFLNGWGTGNQWDDRNVIRLRYTDFLVRNAE